MANAEGVRVWASSREGVKILPHGSDLQHAHLPKQCVLNRSRKLNVEIGTVSEMIAESPDDHCCLKARIRYEGHVWMLALGKRDIRPVMPRGGGLSLLRWDNTTSCVTMTFLL